MTLTALHLSRRSLAALVLGGALVMSSACDIDVTPSAAATSQPRAERTVLTTSAPRARANNGPRINEKEFREDLTTAQNVVDTYWRTNWSKFFTGSYKPPTVVGLYDGRDPENTPRCGNELLKADNAAYCPGGDFVAWDVNLMRTGYSRGDTWVYMVIAHEWGHAIQDRLQEQLVSEAAELQADCMAGAALYGATKDGTLRFEAGDAQEIVAGFRAIGDDTPWTKPGDHGSAAQRLRNFERGGQGGVKACIGS